LRELAPTGALRIAFIRTNPVHVVKDKDARGFRGPAVDLGRELAKWLGVPFDALGDTRAEDMVASAKSGRRVAAFPGFDRTSGRP
jgi:polar amino acid transport system substrate-binding protein